MIPRTRLPIVLLLALLVASAPAEEPHPVTPAEAVRLVTWNLENLFDAADDPEHEDRVPGPRAVEQKLANLAAVLVKLGGEVPPEIVAVQEIESEDLLCRLGKRVHGEKPLTVRVAHGKDRRGMGVGLLTTWRILESRVVLDGEPASRPILIARLAPPGQDAPALSVIVVHLKSMRPMTGEGPLDDDRRRLRQAGVLRGLVDAIRKETPGAHVAVAGDFNADVGAHAMAAGLGAATDEDGVRASPRTSMFDAVARLSPSARGTTHWSFNAPPAWRAWATLDHVLLSASLLGKGALRLDPDAGPLKRGVEVHRFDRRPRKFRAPKGIEETEEPIRFDPSLGVSDHFPLIVWLRVKAGSR